MMLPRVNRLSASDRITRAIRYGKQKRSLALIGYFLSGTNKPTAVSVVVSRQVNSSAVKRNQIKRRLREILRKEIVPKLQDGYDVVIRAIPTTHARTFLELKNELLRITQQYRK